MSLNGEARIRPGLAAGRGSRTPSAARSGRACHAGEVAEQVAAVSVVLDAIERRDWTRLELLLHPEIHWTTAAEEDLHGHRAVIDRLSRDPPPAPPAWHEVRDSRMHRWIDVPG